MATIKDPENTIILTLKDGEVVIELLADVAPEQWQRAGRRSNGSVFTVASLGTYYLHDVVHHLHDVGR